MALFQASESSSRSTRQKLVEEVDAAHRRRGGRRGRDVPPRRLRRELRDLQAGRRPRLRGGQPGAQEASRAACPTRSCSRSRRPALYAFTWKYKGRNYRVKDEVARLGPRQPRVLARDRAET